MRLKIHMHMVTIVRDSLGVCIRRSGLAQETLPPCSCLAGCYLCLPKVCLYVTKCGHRARVVQHTVRLT